MSLSPPFVTILRLFDSIDTCFFSQKVDFRIVSTFEVEFDYFLG